MDIYIRFSVNEMIRACNSGILEQLAAVTKQKTEELTDNGPKFPSNEPAQQTAIPSQPAQPQPIQQPIPQQTTSVPVTPTTVQTTPSQTQTPSPAPTPAVPTATQTYTMEQLAVAATQLIDAGRRKEVVQLLNQFGVQALTALPKEQYGAFATALRQLGAKI